MSYKNVIKETAEELNLPEEYIDKVYKSFWKAIKNKIESLPLKEDLTDDEFSCLQTNFNIPSVGKLNCTLKRYKKIKYIYKKWKNTNTD